MSTYLVHELENSLDSFFWRVIFLWHLILIVAYHGEDGLDSGLEKITVISNFYSTSISASSHRFLMSRFTDGSDQGFGLSKFKNIEDISTGHTGTHFGKSCFLDFFSYFLQYLFAENKSRIT